MELVQGVWGECMLSGRVFDGCFVNSMRVTEAYSFIYKLHSLLYVTAEASVDFITAVSSDTICHSLSNGS